MPKPTPQPEPYRPATLRANCTYDGPTDEAPKWLKVATTHPFRRFLVHPITFYAVIITGISVANDPTMAGWPAYIAAIPTVVLLLQIGEQANKHWYRAHWDKIDSRRIKLQP
jgi:hypothetical protein